MSALSARNLDNKHMPLQQPAADPSFAYWQTYRATLPTIGEAWITACKRVGSTILIRDTQGTVLSATKALVGSIVLSKHFSRLSPEQNIGILLPSSSASVLSNLACMLLGKTAVNLNFTASTAALRSSLQQADIRTVYTSARFLERLQGRGIDTSFLHTQCKVVQLEDLRAATSTLQKLRILLCCQLLPVAVLQRMFCREHDPEQNAVILFSSGSEGHPKGVMLSHRSIMANVKQCALLFNFASDDVILANLPPFHAFGLTATYFLPVLEGVPIFCHADPTDVSATAQALAEHKITAMFGTSSFFRLYVKNNKVLPEQLASLRLLVAGAEKLQPEVRSEFKHKFGKDIYEGYGATETAPVASCNLPEDKRPPWVGKALINKTGSVGLPLPGTCFYIVDPDSFEPLPTGTPGMVLISGPQVMHGYLDNHALTQHVIRTLDDKRWYVSGDKGYLDADGFLFIQDRYSRFAKIGGEMVGLGTVERALKDAVGDPELELLVTILPCDRKGEKLVALCTQVLDPQALRDKLLASGLNALAIPALCYTVAEIPKLGSGKTDFAAAKKLAADLCRGN